MALEARMDAVEAEQVRMREEIRAVQRAPFINARLLNSLRETQLEHGRRLDGIDGRLDGLKQGIDTIIDMLTGLEKDDGRAP